jgi:uncharacterized membrane protein YGL010W
MHAELSLPTLLLVYALTDHTQALSIVSTSRNSVAAVAVVVVPVMTLTLRLVSGVLLVGAVNCSHYYCCHCAGKRSGWEKASLKKGLEG